MSDTITIGPIRMELDKAFQYAVSLAWGDFQATKSRSIRVEYLCEPGVALDHLSVWSVTAGGYHNLVCDYWTRTSSSHPSGIRFGQGHYSNGLTQTLDFIMNNQGQFTRPPDACCHGTVLIYPPDGDDRTEAATWMRVVQAQALESKGGAGEAPEPPKDQRQDEEGWSRMDGEGDPHERTATLTDATGCSATR
jgi:hypothetical protein